MHEQMAGTDLGRKPNGVRDHTAGGTVGRGHQPSRDRRRIELPEHIGGGPRRAWSGWADEVSALTAAQFVAHAQLYQAVSAQAAAIHEMFVNTLGTSTGSYAATEAANAAAAG